MIKELKRYNNSVICSDCPCMKSGEYEKSCNLGYTILFNEVRKIGWTYISDNCELVVIVTKDEGLLIPEEIKDGGH